MLIREEDNYDGEQYSKKEAMIVVGSIKDFVGIDSPTNFRGLRKI
jgi:hypothetical protein